MPQREHRDHVALRHLVHDFRREAHGVSPSLDHHADLGGSRSTRSTGPRTTVPPFGPIRLHQSTPWRQSSLGRGRSGAHDAPPRHNHRLAPRQRARMATRVHRRHCEVNDADGHGGCGARQLGSRRSAQGVTGSGPARAKAQANDPQKVRSDRHVARTRSPRSRFHRHFGRGTDRSCRNQSASGCKDPAGWTRSQVH